jgi:hypothetical protein
MSVPTETRCQPFSTNAAASASGCVGVACDDSRVTAATLASFLVIYVGFLALIGFVAFILRGVVRLPVSNRTLLRLSSAAAFVLAFVLWFFVLPQVTPG